MTGVQTCALPIYATTDNLIYIHDHTGKHKLNKLGADPWYDFVANGTQTPAIIVYQGPIFCNTNLTFVGYGQDTAPPMQIPLRTIWVALRNRPLFFGSPNRADLQNWQAVRVAGDIGFQFVPLPGTPPGGVPNPPPSPVRLVNLFDRFDADPTNDIILRDEFAYASEDVNFETKAGLWLDDRGLQGTFLNFMAPPGRDAFMRVVERIKAPDVTIPDPGTGLTHIETQTKLSGQRLVIADVRDNRMVNDGELARGRGIYIDNDQDVQFNHDLDRLVRDWLRQLDVNTPANVDSGWNALYTLYAPKGVEVTLFPSENVITRNGTRQVCTDENPDNCPFMDPNNGGPGPTWDPNNTPIWWPRHVAGQPGIRLVRHDKPWETVVPGASGPTVKRTRLFEMYLDYPQNGILAAAGNIRIKGVLPPRERLLNGQLERAYNLTVYSGATIYVDGELLRPSSVRRASGDPNDPLQNTVIPLPGGRPPRLEGDPHLDDPNVQPSLIDTDPPDPEVDLFRDSHLALVALDHVCLNPTQLVPQQAASQVPTVDDSPTDPQAGNHLELNLPGDQILSEFPIPGTFNPFVGSQFNLIVRQTGEDQGPSLISLLVNGAAYRFGPGNNVGFMDVGEREFAFLPPGVVPPGPNVSMHLSPEYEYLRNPFARLPWLVPMYNGPAPGAGIDPQVRFAVGVMPRDVNTDGVWDIPNHFSILQSRPGSTEYWVRKWKIEEIADFNGDGVLAPTEAVGALDIRVEAVVHAQRGSWFIIPGEYFESDPVRDLDRNGDGAPDFDVDGINPATPDQADFDLYARRMQRYNYRLTFIGCLSQDHTAPIVAVHDWLDKWSYPGPQDTDPQRTGTATAAGWYQIRYLFDPTYSMTVDNPYLAATPETNLGVLPALPPSGDLLFLGEPQ